jgi:hypothetical protein
MLRMGTNIAIFGAFLVIASFLGFFLWQTLFTTDEYDKGQVQHEQTYSEQQPSSEHPLGGSSSPSTRDSTDQAIANYTKWVAIFTLFLVLATIALFVSGERNVEVARKSANAARKSADTAERTLIATQRPWVDATFDIASDLIFDGEGAHITFNYILANYGNTPAINVDVHPRLIVHDFGEANGEPPNITIVRPATDPAAELLKLCKEQVGASEAMAKSEWLTGDTIFPTNTIRNAVKLSIPKQQIDAAVTRSGHGLILPYLIVCVVYRFPFDSTSHYTGKIWIVRRRIDGDIRPSEGTIAGAILKAEPHPFRSGLAN